MVYRHQHPRPGEDLLLVLEVTQHNLDNRQYDQLSWSWHDPDRNPAEPHLAYLLYMPKGCSMSFGANEKRVLELQLHVLSEHFMLFLLVYE
jgi:hypothetical protein